MAPGPHARLLLTTLLSLALLPSAAAGETQTCENAFGGGLPYEAEADLPTGTSVDAEAIRCWTFYDDPLYLHYHRSVNLTVEDETTGLRARGHVSEYAGGINNWENGTNWSYYGYVAAAEVSDRDGLIPAADLLVHHYGSSVNEEDSVRYHVLAGIAYAGYEEGIEDDFEDPYTSTYETHVEPLLP